MKLRHTHALFTLVLLFALGLAPALAQQRVLTPELIQSVRTIVDVDLSPDGNSAVFQVALFKGDKPAAAISEIWMLRAGGGDPWRFTYNEASDRSPRWSPDGRTVAFLSQRGDPGSTQIYVIPVTGGEARRLTNAKNSVLAFKWSPDGSSIAYLVTDPKTDEEIKAEKEGRDWTVHDKNYKHKRLFVADARSGESKLIATGAMTVHDFDWSPDGKRFLLSAADTPTIDDEFMKQKLMIVSSMGGEPRLLVPTRGKLNSARWSPDGKWIAWLGATSFNDPYAGSVFVVSSEGGTAQNLLEGYEGTANWLGWQPGTAATIIFGSIERQANRLYSISPTEKRKQQILAQAIVYNGGPSFSSNGRRMAMIGNTPTHPNEIFIGETGAAQLARATSFNPQLAGVALGEQEIVKWKSVDGLEIEGVIVKPVGFERGRRYPTVMQPHGGPESADLNGWLGTYSRWGQMLAGRGFVTFYPNYRGSIGRGVDFAKGDHRDLMGKEYQDMVAGLDHLVAIGISDRDRTGVGGGSYGGYTSAWAATYGSERFKAAVAWMGISNWFSMTGTSDIFLENSTVHWDLMMYDNFEIYWERSPIAHIKKANTPTLIIHGAVDPRVPPGQSLELYTAMKWKGVPVEYVTYPREGHGVGEKAHQLDFMNRVTAWFEKYLKNGDEGK